MKKNRWIGLVGIAVLCLIPCTLPGQDTAKQNSDALLILARQRAHKDKDQGLRYAETAFRLGQLKSNLSLQIESYKVIAKIYREHQDTRKYMAAAQQLLSMYPPDSLKTNDYATQLILAGDAYYRLNQNDSATRIYRLAMDIYQANDNKTGIGNSYLKLGNTFYFAANYELALDYYLRALRIFESQKETLLSGKALTNIGLIYNSLEDHDLSLEYFHNALSLTAREGNEYEVIDIYSRIANAYRLKGDFAKAIEYYNNALVLIREYGYQARLPNVLRGLGLIHFARLEIDVAEDNFKTALDLLQKQDSPWGIVLVLMDKANIALYRGNNFLAEDLLLQAKEMATRIKSRELIRNANLNLSNLYSKTGQHQKSLEHFKVYKAESDSLITELARMRINQLQTTWDLEKKETEIRLKDLELEQIQNQISRQRSRLTILMVSFLMVIAISLLLVKQMKLQRQREVETRQVNLELDRTVREKTSELRLALHSIDHAADLIFWLNPGGQFIYSNLSACNMLGYFPDEILRLSVIDMVFEHGKSWWESTWNHLKESRSLILETHLITKNGISFPAEVLMNYIRHEGVEYVFAFARDISERKGKEESLRVAKEKAEESDRLKSAFLANMSHEIRTPMNAIVGFSDLLLQPDYTTDEKAEFTTLIKNSGASLLGLIDDIIDLSLIEAGQLKIKVTEVIVFQLLQEIYLFFNEEKARRGKAHLELVLTVPPRASGLTVHTDPLRLKQVFTNLLGNALKFTEKGKIEFGYSIQADKIEFFTRDTGIGIPEQKHEAIFERFHKLDDKAKIYGGTGLGLTISKKIMNLLGGDIRLESYPQKGTTFYFTVPLGVDWSTAGKNKNEVEESDTETIEYLKGKKILVVEDVDSNFLLIQTLLRKTGVEMIRAIDGLKAVEMANQNPDIDLVLMDIQLPEMDGYTATREIRKTRPDLPIVAQTAYAFSGEKEKILSAGCNDYIAKPIKQEILFRTLKTYLINGSSNT